MKPALQLHLPHYYRWAQRYSTFRHPVASVFFQIARTPHATNTSIDRAYLGSPPPLCLLSPMAKATEPARRSALSWVGFEISVVPSIHRAKATSCPTNGCAIRFDRRGPAIPPLVLSFGARGGGVVVRRWRGRRTDPSSSSGARAPFATKVRPFFSAALSAFEPNGRVCFLHISQLTKSQHCNGSDGTKMLKPKDYRHTHKSNTRRMNLQKICCEPV